MLLLQSYGLSFSKSGETLGNLCYRAFPEIEDKNYHIAQRRTLTPAETLCHSSQRERDNYIGEMGKET